MDQPNYKLVFDEKNHSYCWVEANQNATTSEVSDKYYKFHKLTYSLGAISMPCTDIFIKREKIGDEISIFIGEKGSGLKYFYQWLNQGEDLWMLLDLNAADEADEGAFQQFKNSASGHFFIDRSHTFLTDLDKKTNQQRMAQIVGIVEKRKDNLLKAQQKSDTWKLICITYGLRGFKDDPLFSNLVDRAHVYCMPRLDANDLKEWLRFHWKVQPSETEDYDNLSQELYGWSGGQPRLLEAIKAALGRDSHESDRKKKLIAACRHVRDNPPEGVSRWKSELKHIIEKEYGCKQLMEKFANGNLSKGPASEAEKILFMIGWLGMEDDRQWKIRSRCHQRWAQEILEG